MRDSVPSGSYSSVCNVLRQWQSRSSLLIESTDSMIESTDSMIYKCMQVLHALVGGAISIRDRSFTSLCQRIAHCLPQARCLCSENVAIGFKTSIEAYFVEKKTALGRRSCSR